jgi:hypothetical protein
MSDAGQPSTCWHERPQHARHQIDRCQIEQGAIANASFDLEFDPQLV